MAEFHLENNYLYDNGLKVDPVLFDKKIWELITVFGSSKFLYKNFEEEKDFFEKAKNFELSKISELLISIAVMARSLIDNSSYIEDDNDDRIVGSIVYGDSNNPNKLKFRMACNKIIHLENINFDIDEGVNIKNGFINPIVYLYGEEYQGGGEEKNKIKWKATIDIIKFCKKALKSF